MPAWNEQEVIEQAVVEADEALRALTSDYEILVVDDGSRDGTRELALRLAQQRPHVRVLWHDTNRGYGAALRTGFQAATKDLVGFTDADCQFDLRQLDRLVMLLADADIACGYRIDRQDGWHRLCYSRGYNLLVRGLLRTGVRDCDCALKLFRRDVLAQLSITTDGFLVNAELLSRAAMSDRSIVEVGVNHRPRPRGASTVSILHIFPVLLALLQFWWTTILFPRRAGGSDELSVSRWGGLATCAAGVGLLAVAGLLLLGNLSYPFLEPDESRYAQIALEMLQSGDFLVPRLLGEPYLDKPPLLYWVTAASFRLCGATEFAARLPMALAAMLTVLVSFVLGSRLTGSRPAFLAALLMLLSLGFVLSGRFLIMDGLLTLFLTVCLLASVLALRGREVRTAWWILAAVACGLGIMTKGPVAVVLAIPPLVALQWLDADLARLRWRHWCLYGTILLLLTSPWFVLITQHQQGFTGHFLWKHHVLRFVAAFNHEAPIWYYLPVLLIGMFPASLLAAPAVDFVFGFRPAVRTLRTRELGALTLTAIWILLFFSLSSCKLPTYVLPAVPLLCLLQGTMLHHLLDGRYARDFWARVAARLPVHASDLAVATGTGIAAADLWLGPDPGAAWLLNYLVLGGASAYLLFRLAHRRAWTARPASWSVAAAVSLLIMAFAFQSFVPELAGYRSIHANAARLRQSADGIRTPVVYFDWQSDGSSFYLPVSQIRRLDEDDLATMSRLVREHPRLVVIADAADVRLLQEKLGREFTFTRSPGARGRLYLLTAPPALPTIVGARSTPIVPR
jgi:dolichol-phosphate mannosyltransferase